MESLFETNAGGATIADYMKALIISAAGILIVFVFNRIILKWIKKKAAETETKLDDVIVALVEKIMPLLYFAAVYFGFNSVSLGDTADAVVDKAGIIISTLVGLNFLSKFTEEVLKIFWPVQNAEDAEQEKKNLSGVMVVINVLIWVIGIIVLMDNLGYKVSTIVAGLGIGGIAVALAAQAVLGDLFAYFSILFDKPFRIGDVISVNGITGTLETIGIKTARIRNLRGEEVIIPTSDLTKSMVNNFKKMHERRVVASIGVIYGTPSEKLRKIPEIIKDIITNHTDVRFDRAHFASYGDYSLNFEIVYYVLSPDYAKFMDIQQEVNLKIYEAFEREKIEFAYPTSTVYVKKEN